MGFKRTLPKVMQAETGAHQYHVMNCLHPKRKGRKDGQYCILTAFREIQSIQIW